MSYTAALHGNSLLPSLCRRVRLFKLTDFPKYDVEQIQMALSQLEQSPAFIQAGRMARFLRFVVEEVVAGRADRLNQFAIGVEVFDRDETFDPTVDSVVRVEASRLRNKLREYYATNGRNDHIRFGIPKGAYAAEITIDTQETRARLEGKKDDISGTRADSHRSPDTLSSTVPNKFSIAVLPIEPLTNQPEDTELADAISIETLNRLGQGFSFNVTAWHSVRAFKGQSAGIPQVAKKLAVNYVLEGSLRRAGERRRIAVSLVDGESGQQVWSETYDHMTDDLFEIQEVTARRIVGSLGGALWRASLEKAERMPLDQLDPAGLVYRASGMTFKYSRRLFAEGEELARRALEMDPNLGHGYALLAFYGSHKAWNCWTQRGDELRQGALVNADRAVELEPNDSWVLSLTADALAWLGRPQRGYLLMEHAHTIEPASLLAQGFLGDLLCHVGRPEEALAHINEAIDRSPRDGFISPWHHFAGYAHSELGRYDEAVRCFRTAVAHMSECPPFWMGYANALVETGELDDAQMALDELLRLSPKLTLTHLERCYQEAFVSDEVAETLLSGLRRLHWPET